MRAAVILVTLVSIAAFTLTATCVGKGFWGTSLYSGEVEVTSMEELTELVRKAESLNFRVNVSTQSPLTASWCGRATSATEWPYAGKEEQTGPVTTVLIAVALGAVAAMGFGAAMLALVGGVASRENRD